MLGLSQRGLIGIVLMLVGTAAFFPAVFPGSAPSPLNLLPLAAAALLTLGTYLVGTDVEGRPA
ncbi:hypothetical protein ACOZ4L_12520 [Haloplanus ruber]|uniref:XapX domain-containing protein n=1 Tax=Haloplanus ruber TaxID=869892 RepID=A0ABD6CWU4_9EURY|nr:hypothetical protein [Haloplanus ruber]